MILTFITPFLLFIIGLALGSFATMASHRIPRKEGLVVERSHCPHCNHALGVKDLFPLFSWLLQRGKCRYCKKPISRRYPVIELVTGSCFMILYFTHGVTLHALPLYILTVSLMILAVIDLEHMIIPDGLQIFHLLLTIILFIWGWLNSMEALLGAAIAAAIALFLHYIYGWLRKKEMLGLGDVKFIPICGALVGLHSVVFFFLLAGFSGTILGLFVRAYKGTCHYPFGPALALSLWMCLVFDAGNWLGHFEIWLETILLGPVHSFVRI
ncbi:MAG: prepilin peptidase [Alphaproteobacteria bacterium]|nr:prepilin peptidase [Alphaproteobacteria bacterium]